MLQMSITIKGDKEVQAKLKRLGHSLLDFKKAMDSIGDELSRYYANEAFNSQGGVYGNVWPALKQSTIQRKMSLYPQSINMPLTATGTMRDSFVSISNKDSVVITNEAPYYKYHQSTAPRRKLPRRQMAGINSAVKSRVKRIIEDDIRRKLREA